MSDISASERRLSAALDRIDQMLERESRKTAPSWPDAGLQTALESVNQENKRLKAQLAAIASPPAEKRTESAADWSEAMTRLVAANAELTAANRALIEAAGGKSDAVAAVRLAFEQEIESFHALRAVEAAQLEDLMAELTRLLDDPEIPAQEKPQEQARPSGVGRDTPEDSNETVEEDN